jgi:hypothetical protein
MGLLPLAAGGILWGGLVGVGIGFGIGFGRVFGGHRWFLPVMSAAAVGILLGISLLQSGALIGMLYAAGIALSVVLGQRFKKGGRVLAWAFLGTSVGILVALIAPPVVRPLVPFMALGITVGVGIADARIK